MKTDELERRRSTYRRLSYAWAISVTFVFLFFLWAAFSKGLGDLNTWIGLGSLALCYGLAKLRIAH